MMFSVPAGNALIFSDPSGTVLDTPVTAAVSRDVTSATAESA
jgi:hypothetical protein